MIRQQHIAIVLIALAVTGIDPAVLQHKVVFQDHAVVLRKVPPPIASPAPHDARLRRAPFPGPIAAQFTRIIDGDTFEARVRIWFGQEITTLVRIRGFDAPELKSRCKAEAQGAKAASDLLEALLANASVELSDIALDKYGGRVLANVTIATPADPPENIASIMLATGIVRSYAGGKRGSWCESPENVSLETR